MREVSEANSCKWAERDPSRDSNRCEVEGKVWIECGLQS